MRIPNLCPFKEDLIAQMEAKENAQKERIEKLKKKKGEGVVSMEDYAEIVQGRV